MIRTALNQDICRSECHRHLVPGSIVLGEVQLSQCDVHSAKEVVLHQAALVPHTHLQHAEHQLLFWELVLDLDEIRKSGP
ncbi:hypothetical protein RRG08_063708 [Elysia crispata]|uniref:Uncharacterized protein n=1 Tax=Elysia crispata TaxID=231223 RepID=A0AAE0XQE1_9GAST|nr:hypothetical protein RRG08_063708 [Elysia crispata]